AIEPAWRMIVHGPAAVSHGVIEIARGEIVLRENVIPDNTAAASFARHHPHPIQSEIGGIRIVAAVLDVVPDAHHNREQFETNTLVLADDVAITAPFDPPVTVLP